MKVTSVNPNKTLIFKAQKISMHSANNLKYKEFKQFMTEIDAWTNENLQKIDKKYISGTQLKESAIESLFAIREIKIQAKKQELFPEERYPLWRKVLVSLGILNY